MSDDDYSQRVAKALSTGQASDLVAMLLQAFKENGTPPAMKALATKYGSGFQLADVLATATDEQSERTLRHLAPLLIYVDKVTLKDATALLEFLSRKPSHWHLVFQPLAEQFKRNPALASELHAAFETDAIAGATAAKAWAAALTESHPQKAAEYVIEAIAGSPGSKKIAVQLSIYLEMKFPAVRDVLLKQEQGVLQLLHDLAGNDKESSEAWAALCRFAEISQAAMDELQKTVRDGPTVGMIAVADWLMRYDAPVIGPNNTDVTLLVGPLLDASLARAELQPSVDSMLASFLYRDKSAPIAEAALLGLGQLNLDLTESFSRALTALIERPTSFTRILTTWLVAPSVGGATVRSLLNQCFGYGAPVALDAALFDKQTPEVKGRAVSRLLALTHNGPTVCQFAGVIAENTELQPYGMGLAAEMLIYLMDEFPHSTQEFLAAKTAANKKNTPVGKMYHAIYKAVLSRKRELDNLPELKELRPSETEFFSFRKLMARRNRDMFRTADENSLMSQLVSKKSHIKQGSRFASHNAFGPPQIGEMSSMGVSIELRASERNDPVGGEILRARLLGAFR